ncbi:MazG-like family protein [Sphingomonas sp.]|uniref:MazG-like family protein n=1 Tax=Sphingomonas sp. TaxID=28214 RepID=UPI002ED862A7
MGHRCPVDDRPFRQSPCFHAACRTAPTIAHVTLRDANRARQREWDADNQITLAYRGNELAGEAGEACNVIKKIERERLGIRGSRDTIEHLAEELADVVICADLIAMAEGIDLDRAVAEKFNATSVTVGLQTRMVVPE